MKNERHYGIEDIDFLLSDRNEFEKFIYTPIDGAIQELLRRRNNTKILGEINNLLNSDIPKQLLEPRPRGVIFRQISSPNYEIRRFVQIIEALGFLSPLFGEYQDDKFTSNNEQKLSWGKIIFHKDNGCGFESLKIVDLIKSDGKKISEVKTLWDESLLGFHHKLFESAFKNIEPSNILNISPWLMNHGGSAQKFYQQVLLWFVQHAILFENFLPGETKELSFTRSVFLPAFIEVYNQTGLKPLIVNLLPTSLENEKFWLSHPPEVKKYIEEKMSHRNV